jgi:hypothetical protein
MCLYPKLIDNPKYQPNKKNNYNPPNKPNDQRILYVPIGCGRCIECKKQKSNSWKTRLLEEIRTDKTGVFVTLTFNEDNLLSIKNKLNKNNDYTYEVDNEIATYAVRHFLELWRKHHKKSIKHWLITELGTTKTERIHIHGILFTDQPNEIKKIWKYGYVYIGQYVNETTINYVSKYMTKLDPKHKEYNQKIYTSKGIGKNYLNRLDSKRNRYLDNKTNETYVSRKGSISNLPIYYRNKLYSDDEREKLWLNKLDREERYVLGTRIDLKCPNGDNDYKNAIIEARRINISRGFGSDIKNDSQKKYEQNRKKLAQLTYISKLKNQL